VDARGEAWVGGLVFHHDGSEDVRMKMWIGGFVNGDGVGGINISSSIIHGILVVFHVACDISSLLFASCHFVRAVDNGDILLRTAGTPRKDENQIISINALEYPQD